MCFSVSKWVLEGLDRFQWVWIGFRVEDQVPVGQNRFQRVLLVFSGSGWVSVGKDGFQWVWTGVSRSGWVSVGLKPENSDLYGCLHEILKAVHKLFDIFRSNAHFRTFGNWIG